MEAQALTPPAALRRAPSTRLLRLRSDDQLVALFRLGHDDAFDALHDRYRARLLAYTRQMLAGSGADPEDALQDVFLRAFHALRADARPVTIRAWLYRVAHNRCIDALRRPVTNDVELPDNVVAMAGSRGADPHDDTQRRDDLRRLVADIERLPEQQRSALLMREMSGMSYQELSDALAVTVPAVKSLLVRARMGLVEAQEARNIACTEIRDDLESAHERGVRASGRSKRHLRECSCCRDYRDALKGVRAGLAALSPDVGGWGTLVKLLGIGGAGSAAGGASVAGGGAAALGGVTLGGGAVAATATKVVAVVAAAAVVGGGVNEVQKRVTTPAVTRAAPTTSLGATKTAAHATAPAAAAAAVTAVVTATAEVAEDAKADGSTTRSVVADPGKADRLPMTPWTMETPAVSHHGGATAVERTDADRAGGILAPDESMDTTGAPAAQAPSEERPAGVQDLLAPKDRPAGETQEPAPAAAAEPAPADAGESEGETSATPGGAAAP